jgi:hypothetical protein
MQKSPALSKGDKKSSGRLFALVTTLAYKSNCFRLATPDRSELPPEQKEYSKSNPRSSGRLDLSDRAGAE